MNLNQNDRKRNIWIIRETSHDLNATSSVKHGGGNVTAWAFMAAGVTRPFVFTDDVTGERNKC